VHSDKTGDACAVSPSRRMCVMQRGRGGNAEELRYGHERRRCQLTQDDSGGHRTTRVGEEPNVVLAENPTTGYRWHSEIDARTLQQTGDHYEGSAGPRGGSRHPSADLQGSPSRPGAPAG